MFVSFNVSAIFLYNNNIFFMKNLKSRFLTFEKYVSLRLRVLFCAVFVLSDIFNSVPQKLIYFCCITMLRIFQNIPT